MISAQHRQTFQNFVATRSLPDGIHRRPLSQSEMAETQAHCQEQLEHYRGLDNQAEDLDRNLGQVELGPAQIYDLGPCPDPNRFMGPILKRAWEATQAKIADDRLKITLTPGGMESELAGSQNAVTFCEQVDGRQFLMEIKTESGRTELEAAVLELELGQGWYFSTQP